MVGLRERVLTKEEIEGGDVGWFKAIFGRRGVQEDVEEVEEDAVAAWARGEYLLIRQEWTVLIPQWSMKVQLLHLQCLVFQNV